MILWLSSTAAVFWVTLRSLSVDHRGFRAGCRDAATGEKREKQVMSGAPRTVKAANGGVRRVGNNASDADKYATHAERFAHLVKLAARGFARALQMRLTEHSVSYGHWTFLRILWDEEGLTQRELSARAGVMEPTTFAALKAMAQRGYVTRRRNPQSRKEMQVLLTPQG